MNGLSKPILTAKQSPCHFSTAAALAACVVAGGILVGCKSGNQGIGTPAPTAAPSPTPVADRGDPKFTPIPAPTTTSALATIRQNGEVRIGILYNDQPFAYLAPNGDLRGFDADLLRKLAEKWGVKAVFVQVTRQTRIPALVSGKVDIIAGSMPHRRELSQFVEFSDTTFQSGVGVLVSNDSGIGSLGDLKGKSAVVIGTGSQTALTAYMGSSGITLTTQLVQDTPSAVAAFSQQGGPQAIVGRLEDLMKASTSLSNVKTLDQLVMSEPYALAVRRGDTPLRDFINMSLQNLIKSGDYGQIYGANLYGNAADSNVPYSGDATYTLATFPADISAGESVVARLKRGQGLKVGGFGGTGQPQPYDGQAIVDGYNRAVMNEIGRRWNVPVQEQPNTTGQTGIDQLRSGQIDLMMGVRPTMPLLGNVALSQGYYQRGLRLINMSGVTLLGINDLEFKVVTIVDPLDVSQDLVTKNSQYAKISQAISNDDAFKSLTGGSSYALVGDEFTMMLMAQADNRIHVFSNRYRAANYVLALRPGDSDFMNLVNFTLQNMKADGTLDKLVAQYFGPYTPADSPFDPVPVDIWPGDGSYLGVGGQ